MKLQKVTARKEAVTDRLNACLLLESKHRSSFERVHRGNQRSCTSNCTMHPYVVELVGRHWKSTCICVV
uniref:Uncharacterized protein n=1 Tax=Trichuris muris TaxID=70415 RepID=A0A5S6QK80_TRIMR